MFIKVPCADHYSTIQHFATDINVNFLSLILNDPKNQCLMYTNGCSDAAIGTMVYRTTKTKTETRFYMLLLAVNPDYQSVGYGSLMLKDLFQQYRTIMNDSTSATVRVVIHPTYDNVRFYYNNGFRRSRENYLYRIIYKYEKYRETDTIMTRRV